MLKYFENFESVASKNPRNPMGLSTSPKRPQMEWAMHPPGVVKINVDVAWKSLPTSTGIGVVFRDSNRSLMGTAARHLDTVYGSPLVEILAIVEGLKFASSRNCPNLIVESDSLQSINLLNEEDPELRFVDC